MIEGDRSDQSGPISSYQTFVFSGGDVSYVPLTFEPGEAIQLDWGQATIILNGVKTQVHLFCMRLCYSIVLFVIAYPTEREETFL